MGKEYNHYKYIEYQLKISKIALEEGDSNVFVGLWVYSWLTDLLLLLLLLLAQIATC